MNRPQTMLDPTSFKPKSVYRTYIAATPEKVWQALVDPSFTTRYFFGLSAEVEPRTGGRFRLLWPDGREHITGEVVDWSPPRRLCVSWDIQNMPPFSELPTTLVTYDIEPAGAVTRLTMTESHDWDVPREIMIGGEEGWPKIISGLKSLLETGNPLTFDMSEGPAPEFVAAVQKAADEKPWLKK
ncbi:SRPBCC domain-containing protein [Pseudolabrys sp. FHR47]|uniref:SRPBCC domain-containing protein n=1 Tax=Pseudolabrys sp. FHR47 TaxID=2562284 RepID=UPI0010BE5F12|nr:SRPBCC domain-containing protein [Pseudolabrys sp. FHR47]